MKKGLVTGTIDPAKYTKEGKPIKGRWVKGQSGNPLGMVRRPEIDQLRKALAKAKIEKKIDFLVDFVKKAYDDKDYAIALFKRIVPSEAFVTKTDKRIIINFKGKLSNEETVKVENLSETS